MSLSTCEHCGGHIPLGPTASNRCEKCGRGVFESMDGTIKAHPRQKVRTAMGTGYWILLWDGWGAGLVMLNPRLHTDGVDCYGNPRNWFPHPNGEEMANGHDLRAKHGITAKHFQPIDFND